MGGWRSGGGGRGGRVWFRGLFVLGGGGVWWLFGGWRVAFFDWGFGGVFENEGLEVVVGGGRLLKVEFW